MPTFPRSPARSIHSWSFVYFKFPGYGIVSSDVILMLEGAYFFSLAPGPHPRRVLTPMPRFGFARPQLGMAAGAPSRATRCLDARFRSSLVSLVKRHRDDGCARPSAADVHVE